MANLNEVKIIGVKLGTNKNTGRPSNIICYIKPWSDYDLENGASGECCESRWTNCDFSGIKLGDTVELIWTPGFQDRPQLTGWRLIKHDGK